MTTNFRTFIVVAEIDDESELCYPGVATDRVHNALEPVGFVSLRVRNEPNPDGEMPPQVNGRGLA